MECEAANDKQDEQVRSVEKVHERAEKDYTGEDEALKRHNSPGEVLDVPPKDDEDNDDEDNDDVDDTDEGLVDEVPVYDNSDEKLDRSLIIAGALYDMVRISPGTFVMGSPETEPGRNKDETQHEVTLTHGFYLGKYPVERML